VHPLIPKSKKTPDDALSLAEEVLSDLERSKTRLTTVSPNARRLARLFNNPERQRIFQLEVSSYPHQTAGMPPVLTFVFSLGFG